MAADYLWLWDNINSVWVKAQCDASGNLTVDLSGLPSEYPLPAAQVTDLKAITSYPDPVISQLVPTSLNHVPHGRYVTDGTYKPFSVGSTGKLQLEIAALQHLSDIADVNLTGLTTGDFIYWDASTSKWERIAHKDATTGVHGVGTLGFKLSATFITSTRSMETASGNVSYTGTGFQPVVIIMLAAAQTASMISSWSIATSAANSKVLYGNPTPYIKPYGSLCFRFTEDIGGTKMQYAELASLDANGLTLTWTKVGTPAANTVELGFLCLK